MMIKRKNRKMLFIISFVFITLLTSSYPALGSMQNDLNKSNKEGNNKSEILNRFYFGGHFGLQFGAITDIVVAPLAGYRITTRLSIGTGFTYEYYHVRTPFYSYGTNIYGPKLFSRYLFIKRFSNILPVKFNGGLFLEGDYETLNMDNRYFGTVTPTTETGNRFWIHSWLGGIGLHEPVGPRSAVNIILLFYLGETHYTPYSNPVFRVELSF